MMIGAAVRFSKQVKCRRIIIKLYNVYMRPILEYCVVFWTCGDKKYIKKLENVYKKITSIATNNPPYWMPTYKTYAERLHILQATTPNIRNHFLITKLIIQIIKKETETSAREKLINLLNRNQLTRNPNIFLTNNNFHRLSTLQRGITLINDNRTDIFVNINGTTAATLKQLKINITNNLLYE